MELAIFHGDDPADRLVALNLASELGGQVLAAAAVNQWQGDLAIVGGWADQTHALDALLPLLQRFDRLPTPPRVALYGAGPDALPALAALQQIAPGPYVHVGVLASARTFTDEPAWQRLRWNAAALGVGDVRVLGVEPEAIGHYLGQLRNQVPDLDGRMPRLALIQHLAAWLAGATEATAAYCTPWGSKVYWMPLTANGLSLTLLGCATQPVPASHAVTLQVRAGGAKANLCGHWRMVPEHEAMPVIAQFPVEALAACSAASPVRVFRVEPDVIEFDDPELEAQGLHRHQVWLSHSDSP